jgi:hypothetical protein
MFIGMFDRRVMTQLSGDDNARQGLIANMQMLLDMQASEFEFYINGRYPLPLPFIPWDSNVPTPPGATKPMPLAISKWVGVTTTIRMYGRRTDRPKQLDAEEEWAKTFLDKLIIYAVTIPGVNVTMAPMLQDSDFYNGYSQFDNVFGQCSPPWVGWGGAGGPLGCG